MRLPEDAPVAARHPLTDGWRSATAIALPSDAASWVPSLWRAARPDAFDRVDVRAPRERRHAALPGHQERPAVRRDQADAPGQPDGPELRPERQGLLHPGPRRARGRVHRDARPQAAVGARADGLAGGGRLPARHRQDQHLRPRAAQAGPPEPAGVAADAAAPGVQRRHHPAPLPQGARGRRPAPPRALRRRRVPGRPRRASRSRCSPAPWPWWTPTTPCRCRRPYKAALTYSECLAGAAPLPRHAVRPRDGRRLPRGPLGARDDARHGGAHRRRGRLAHPRRQAPRAARTRGRGLAGVRGDPRDPARGARRQPADQVPDHARADGQEVRDRRRPRGERGRPLAPGRRDLRRRRAPSRPGRDGAPR